MLFYIAIRNIWRQKFELTINILIGIFVVLLISMYWSRVESSRNQLENLSDVLPVYCRITNLNGSQDVGLLIKESLVQNLQASQQVENACYSVQLMAGIGDFPIDTWKKNLNLFVSGTNSIQTVNGLNEKSVTLKDDTELSFLDDFSLKCIVSQSLMEKNKWKLGDYVPLKLFYYEHIGPYEVNMEPMDINYFEIVGKMEEPNLSSSVLPTDIIVSFETIRTFFNQSGNPTFADSFSFYVKEPLNLNDFKEEMKNLGLMQVVPSAQYDLSGNALIMKDGTFIQAATNLKQSIFILEFFSSFIYTSVIILGFVISWISVYHRKSEVLIMGLMGTSKWKSFIIFFYEHFVQAFLGAAIGNGISFFFWRGGINVIYKASTVFVSGYLLGTAMALLLCFRGNAMKKLPYAD